MRKEFYKKPKIVKEIHFFIEPSERISIFKEELRKLNEFQSDLAELIEEIEENYKTKKEMKFTLEETKSGKYSVVRVNNTENSFRTSSKLSLFKNMMNTETKEITI